MFGSSTFPEARDRVCEIRQALVRSGELGAKVLVVDGDLGSASPARELCVIAKPSESFWCPVVALQTGDVDLAVFEYNIRFLHRECLLALRLVAMGERHGTILFVIDPL